MDTCLTLVAIAFMISTLIDVLIIFAIFFLFYKIFRTKKLASVNNREIYEHDKILVDLQEQVEEIRNHE